MIDMGRLIITLPALPPLQSADHPETHWHLQLHSVASGTWNQHNLGFFSNSTTVRPESNLARSTAAPT
jgi:hypothetical protein